MANRFHDLFRTIKSEVQEIVIPKLSLENEAKIIAHMREKSGIPKLQLRVSVAYHYLTREAMQLHNGLPDIVLGEVSSNEQFTETTSSLTDVMIGEGGSKYAIQEHNFWLEILKESGATFFTTDIQNSLKDKVGKTLLKLGFISKLVGNAGIGYFGTQSIHDVIQEVKKTPTTSRREFLKNASLSAIFLGARIAGPKLPNSEPKGNFITYNELRVRFRNISMIASTWNVLSRIKDTYSYQKILFYIAAGHNTDDLKSDRIQELLLRDPKEIEEELIKYTQQFAQFALYSFGNKKYSEALSEVAQLAYDSLIFSNPDPLGPNEYLSQQQPNEYFHSPKLIFIKELLNIIQNENLKQKDLLLQIIYDHFKLIIKSHEEKQTQPITEYEQITVPYEVFYKTPKNKQYSFYKGDQLKITIMGVANVFGIPYPLLSEENSFTKKTTQFIDLYNGKRIKIIDDSNYLPLT